MTNFRPPTIVPSPPKPSPRLSIMNSFPTFQEMKIGEVKIAEDSDFLILKSLIDDHSNWKLAYEKANHTKVRITMF